MMNECMYSLNSVEQSYLFGCLSIGNSNLLSFSACASHILLFLSSTSSKQESNRYLVDIEN